MYLEIDEGFVTHRKTLRFCALMQNHNAFAYILRLWSWACRSAPDGDLGGMEATDIEIAVQYNNADGKCYQALVKAGFVDDVDGKPAAIHNWSSRTGAAIRKMADEAARKKAWRDARGAAKCTERDKCDVCRRQSVGNPHFVHGQSTDSPRTVDRTSDTDKTSQDQTSFEESPPAGAPARDLSEPTTEHIHQAAGLTGPSLAKLFGRIRCEVTGAGIEWQGTPTSPEKASNMAAAIETMGAAADVEVTIRDFWRRAKAGTLPKAHEVVKSPSFAFGCWCAAFPELLEALRGKAPRAPPEPGAPRCAYHRLAGTNGKRARSHDAACVECRHVAAGAGRREAEPMATPLPTFTPPPAWTDEQKAEFAALTRKGA